MYLATVVKAGTDAVFASAAGDLLGLVWREQVVG